MPQFFEEIPESLIDWINEQKVFWVATAPLTQQGHINLSPKGFEDTFHVISPRRVWYEDLSGSGAETIAHLRENGRITVLFNAFDGPPKIARLFGIGTVYEFGTPEYEELLPDGVRKAGSRAVIMIDVFKVATSCGWSVPFFEFKGHRTQLLSWGAKLESADVVADSMSSIKHAGSKADQDTASAPKSKSGMKSWWLQWCTVSLDGLPALTGAHESWKSFRHAKVPPGRMFGYIKEEQVTPVGESGAAKHHGSFLTLEGALSRRHFFLPMSFVDPGNVIPFLWGMMVALLLVRAFN